MSFSQIHRLFNVVHETRIYFPNKVVLHKLIEILFKTSKKSHLCILASFEDNSLYTGALVPALQTRMGRNPAEQLGLWGTVCLLHQYHQVKHYGTGKHCFQKPALDLDTPS